MEAVAQLAGGVAHDFNNLLTVIQGCTDLALSDLGSKQRGDDRGTLVALEDVQRSAGQAAALTRQLLSLGRRDRTEPHRTCLATIMASAEPLVRRVVPSTIDVQVACGAEQPPILVDPAEVERAVMNLVINARDATPDGGTIRIATRVESLSAEDVASHPDAQLGGYAILVVSDTGHGMDAGTCRRVFEPFFTTKERAGGTGLGLSAVHGIVKQAGGHVRVESTPGVGTTFLLYFPVQSD
ncbi:MAG: hypothetical protein JW751_16100 [Polyangiaceae bacterium]|nr:hypothetical protein [Polyangiaceae bacterium]